MDVNKFSEKIQQEEHFQWELSIEIGKLDVQTSWHRKAESFYMSFGLKADLTQVTWAGEDEE